MPPSARHASRATGALTSPFVGIDRADLAAVTGGLSSTIRTRRQAPEVPSPQPSGVEQKLAGLMGALQGAGQRPRPAPTANPMAGLGLPFPTA
ncbi:MAG: hypothetical protein IPL61_02555 [Myxococcales bacterium]|nr:hypothetical protein [Myxococcales bacterium]